MEQLEKYFDTAFGAPDGVKKLRELILTLSFQGKLTPRQTKVQSVSELLQSIESEKNKLIKSNKIKVKNISNSNEINAGLYELPKGWRWVRLRDISYDLGQKSPSSRFTYIDVGSVDNSAGMITDKVQILDSNEAPSRARKIVKVGTVIYSTVRPYLLNIAIVNQEYKPEPIASTAFAILHPYNGINNKYLYFFLRSPVFISFVEKLMKGVAYPAINDGDLFSGFIPLPPSKEQDEIVDKIDQLMSRCDELEKLRAERDQKRVTVHTAALRKMLDAPDQENFDDAWQFITHHFGDLYTVRENVAELRKATLQLAVMGKLVKNPNMDDSPNSILNKLIQQNENSTPIAKNEIPFTLPRNWEWARFNTVAELRHGHQFRKEDFVKEGIPVVKIGQCKSDGSLDLEGCDYINSNRIDEFANFLIHKGDLLMALTGGTLGKVTRVDKDYGTVVQNYRVGKFLSNELVITLDFLNLVLESDLFQSLVRSKINQNAQPNIGKENIEGLLLPIPPLHEQNTIVQNINKLMNLCKSLEKEIVKLKNNLEVLQGAVMREVV